MEDFDLRPQMQIDSTHGGYINRMGLLGDIDLGVPEQTEETPIGERDE